MQVPTLTQVITHAILESWGYDKFREHTEVVSMAYRKRRDIFDAAMHSTLGGLVEWTPPESGLFFWYARLGAARQLHHANNSASLTRFKLLLKGGNEDSEELIREKAFKKGVLAMPGAPFMPDGGPTQYVRASFSLLEPDEIQEALRRLRDVLLEERSQTSE